jgi:hypothetical protein
MTTSKNSLLVTAMAVFTSATISIAGMANAYAAGPRVSVEQLNKRTAQVPQLAGLNNGDTFTIYDDGSMTGRVWEGTYVYRPAGTRIRLGNAYARWRDGLVAIHMATDPADTNSELDKNTLRPLGTFMEQTYGTGINSDGDEVEAAVSQRQVTKRLIADPTNASILRLPNNAWLYRWDGGDSYVALVDVYEFKSGDVPRRRLMTEWSNDWKEDGAQPVALTTQ